MSDLTFQNLNFKQNFYFNQRFYACDQIWLDLNINYLTINTRIEKIHYDNENTVIRRMTFVIKLIEITSIETEIKTSNENNLKHSLLINTHKDSFIIEGIIDGKPYQLNELVDNINMELSKY